MYYGPSYSQFQVSCHVATLAKSLSNLGYKCIGFCAFGGVTVRKIDNCGAFAASYPCGVARSLLLRVAET